MTVINALFSVFHLILNNCSMKPSCGLQRLNKFPKVTELVHDKPRIQNQVCIITNHNAIEVLGTLNYTISD